LFSGDFSVNPVSELDLSSKAPPSRSSTDEEVDRRYRQPIADSSDALRGSEAATANQIIMQNFNSNVLGRNNDSMLLNEAVSLAAETDDEMSGGKLEASDFEKNLIDDAVAAGCEHYVAGSSTPNESNISTFVSTTVTDDKSNEVFTASRAKNISSGSSNIEPLSTIVNLPADPPPDVRVNPAPDVTMFSSGPSPDILYAIFFNFLFSARVLRRAIIFNSLPSVTHER
jgi:hypothetical protein